MADRFANYAELSAVYVEGTDYIVTAVNKGSKNGITAFHGGGIEIGTTELMRSITDKRPAWSWYGFESLLTSNNSDIHLTSVNYDEPRGTDWLKTIERAVSLHGAAGDTPITYIGGLDTITRDFIEQRLKAKGFVVAESPPEIAGINPENFVNRPKRHGVQLELTTQMRKSFFINDDWSRSARTNKANWTQTMYDYTDAIIEGVELALASKATMWEEDFYTEYEKVFGGVIDRPVAKNASLYGDAKFHGITCADWHYLAGKRIIAKAYKDMAAGDIVRDIIDNYLASEGIKAGDIQQGPVITEAIFNYIHIDDAMESLGEKAAFEWYIDSNRFLHFFCRSAFMAPVSINETSDIRNLQVEPSAEEYRNKQYIRAGKDVTDPISKKFKGDGEATTFTVDYDLALEPVVKVNGVTQTVGIRGLETTQQWFWNKGDKVISQADGDNVTPLKSTDTLEVIFQGYFDIVVVSYDMAAVAEMQDIEGGTGIHEAVLDDPSLTSRTSAFESASAKLRRYARIGSRVSFDTKITGLRPGQIISLDLPSFGIPQNDYLIESVKAAELGTHDGRLIYQVSCVDGAATGGWANFFKKMANTNQTYVIYENIQENEVLITLGSFEKTWSENEVPNIMKTTYPSAELFPGASVYPGFADNDRVKYVSFFDAANNEIFRKSIIKQAEDVPGRLISTATILPFEANGLPIKHIGWFGGSKATEALGSGILVDKQPFVKEKTDLEMMQIEKTDIRGW